MPQLLLVLKRDLATRPYVQAGQLAEFARVEAFDITPGVMNAPLILNLLAALRLQPLDDHLELVADAARRYQHGVG